MQRVSEAGKRPGAKNAGDDTRGAHPPRAVLCGRFAPPRLPCDTWIAAEGVGRRALRFARRSSEKARARTGLGSGKRTYAPSASGSWTWWTSRLGRIAFTARSPAGCRALGGSVRWCRWHVGRCWSVCLGSPAARAESHIDGIPSESTLRCRCAPIVGYAAREQSNRNELDGPVRGCERARLVR